MISVKCLKKSIKKMNLKTTTKMHHRILGDLLKVMEKSKQAKLVSTKPNIWRMLLWSKAGYLGASFLVIASFFISFVLYGKVVDLRNKLDLAQNDIAPTPFDDSVTINFYLKEHQDTIAQYASHDLAASQPIQMQIDQDDLLYYELFDNQTEFLSPGIIVRGPSTQQEIGSSETPAISNGRILTLSKVREAADFDFVSPPWFHPGYLFDQIKMIEDRDTLHLIYTNSINTLSLFEQPLDGQRGLSHQDFREYAVYQNKGQAGGTILAWRDDTLSYVLIGNAEMSQLIEIAQKISAINGRK